LPWQRLEKSKKLNEVKKPLHSFTNHEILVKIGPLVCELPGLECRPLKIKKIKKKTLAKYIALPASLLHVQNQLNQSASNGLHVALS